MPEPPEVFTCVASEDQSSFERSNLHDEPSDTIVVDEYEPPIEEYKIEIEEQAGPSNQDELGLCFFVYLGGV